MLTAFPEGRMYVESAHVCLLCTGMKACRQASAQRSMMTRSVGSSLRDYWLRLPVAYGIVVAT